MRPIAFIGLGVGFLLMGAALFELTLRKPKPVPMNPNKSQLREQTDLAAETKKMRIAAATSAGFGLILALLGVS